MAITGYKMGINFNQTAPSEPEKMSTIKTDNGFPKKKNRRKDTQNFTAARIHRHLNQLKC